MAGSATGTGNIFEFNGHYYEVVNSQASWVQNSLTAGTHQDALDAASQMTYNGLQGHLVTITSQEEQDFLVSILTADGQTGITSSGHQLIHPDSHTGDAYFYTAGSDRDSEGMHVWLDGPEAGQEVNLSFSPPWGTGQPSSHTEAHDAVTLIGGGQKSPGTYAYQDVGTWKSINDGSAGSYTMSELVGGYIGEYSPRPPESFLSSVIVAEGKSGVDFSDTNDNGLIDFNFDGGPYLVRVNFDQPITVGSQYADNHLDLSADGIGFDFIIC